MEPEKIIVILEGTMNPSVQKEAEEKLDQMHKIIGFSPLLLQIVMSPEVQMAIRQAGAIYLKNMCSKWWKRDPDDEGTSGIFFIHENDKSTIRENIVEAVIHSPDVIRSQLNVVVYQILKNDFPERWPAVIDKIASNLANDQGTWMGALQTLYQLTKLYEYKKADERGPLLNAMKIFLPALTQLFQHTLSDNAAHSVLLQKQCLKIIYVLTQHSLPLNLLDETNLNTWMKFIQVVLEKRPPEETLEVDELERPELPWWKAKKWSLHILTRLFERYGSPGSVMKDYVQFAEFFLRRYAVGATHVLINILDEKRNGQYVSPRVVQQILHFLNQGVSHSQTWKVMKDAYDRILKDIIFPLMCFTDKDQELWEDDPYEYVRVKFNVMEDFLCPSSAAQCMLQSACSKRKQVIQKTMTFCHGILTQSGSNVEPRQKDGALHIIGTLSETLLKRKMFKTQMEPMLVSHVYPEFKSSFGYMRARAVWVVQNLSELKFKNVENLFRASDAVTEMLSIDPDPPVRVEAAFSLQALLYDQDKVEQRCVPHLGSIIQSCLKLVHDTENEDMTTVVQKIICLYHEQVIPFAVEITKALVMTFLKMLSAEEENGHNHEDDEVAENRTVAAMGVLNTIETVLDTMEEQRDITRQLEGLVTPIIAHVLKNRVMHFYEEILSLMYSLTCQEVSAEMWEALPLIKTVFDDDGFDYFTEMMPVLHNLCTIDTKSLLASPLNLEIIFNMCDRILKNDAGEDTESHAAKLLEVIILQCRGKIDQCIPSFVGAALSRLTKEIKTSELRTMCLQVVVAAIYYNPTILFQTLEGLQFPNTTEAVTEQFFRQWIKDTDCFLGIHDRRVAVYSWCAVLDYPQRPPVLTEIAKDILPSLIMLLEGLDRAYKNHGDGDSSDDSSSDEDGDSDFEQDELASSEDEVDEESAEYLEMLEKSANNEFDDESIDSEGETALEIYTSSFDEDANGSEYFVFKDVMSKLESTNTEWYQQLVSSLTEDQRKNIQAIMITADQRRAEAESKKIEKTGGYQFITTSVPTSFNFGSGSTTAFSP